MEDRIEINGEWYVKEKNTIPADTDPVKLDETEFKSRVYESDLYCFEASLIMKDDGINYYDDCSIEFKQLKFNKMEKVIRDGKVAVLISHGFGAGWYSWNSNQELLFSPKIVEMVEQNRANEIDEDWVKENLGIGDVYCGGASDLKIHWLPVGTAFEVDEYDGAESLRTLADLVLVA